MLLETRWYAKTTMEDHAYSEGKIYIASRECSGKSEARWSCGWGDIKVFKGAESFSGQVREYHCWFMETIMHLARLSLVQDRMCPLLAST